MFLITGDTHGNFSRFKNIKEKVLLTPEDVVIVLGDARLNYCGNKFDIHTKICASHIGCTFFCVHGNHEMRPETIKSYKTKTFCGGIVYYEDQFPNLLFAKDGEIYKFGDYSCLVIGGAYSVDKHYRLQSGLRWFADEQPSSETKKYVEQQIEKHGNTVDIVLSHTCPLKYEPVEVFLPFVSQDTVDKTTEKWLDEIENTLSYKKWYCGHYHTEKKIDKIEFMFENTSILST